jgi:peptidoglycan/xylan/chitin deacetylase (PgdA/CDA1 family)
MIAAAALTLAALGTLAHGAFYRNSPLFGRALGSLPVGRGERVVALTFDDGPNPEATPRILDALAEGHVKATFFLLGRHVDRWPDIARRVAAEGHTVANHGWHHRKLHRALPARARADLEMGARSIERATGIRPRLFRAPHGFRAPWVTPIAASLGQRTVGWSLGVWDTDRPGARAIVDRTIAGARPGAILLLHDGDGYDPFGDRTQTAEAVPLIVRELHDRGYRFAPVPS